jgi:hypothetical protein
MHNFEEQSMGGRNPHLQKSKVELAAYYCVGLRTIEEWSALGIISGHRKGRKIRFDVADCDRRISAYKN